MLGSAMTDMPSNGLGWGCGNSSYPSSKSSRPHGASANSFIRFHWTGALELSLLILDLYDWQSNLKDLQKYKVIPFGVVEVSLPSNDRYTAMSSCHTNHVG